MLNRNLLHVFQTLALVFILKSCCMHMISRHSFHTQLFISTKFLVELAELHTINSYHNQVAQLLLVHVQHVGFYGCIYTKYCPMMYPSFNVLYCNTVFSNGRFILCTLIFIPTVWTVQTWTQIKQNYRRRETWRAEYRNRK